MSSDSGTPRKQSVLGPCLSDVTLTPTPQKYLASAQSTRSSTTDGGSANRFMGNRRRSSAPHIQHFIEEEEDDESIDDNDFQKRRAMRQGMKAQRIWSPNEETIGWGGKSTNDQPDAFAVYPPSFIDLNLLGQRRQWARQMSAIKVCIKLSILFCVLHLVAIGSIGFSYHISLWESLSIELFLSVIASLILLWRLSGQYGFPKHLAPERMLREAYIREKRCLITQGLAKLMTSGCLFVTSALQKGRLKLAGPEYTAVTYLAAGVTGSGLLLHVIFAIVILLNIGSGLGSPFSSITSEVNFMYILALSSTEVIVFSIISNAGPNDMIPTITYCVLEICIGIAALFSGVWDLWRASKQDMPSSSTSMATPLDLQFEPAFYLSPYRA